jgi:hypothetical protein
MNKETAVATIPQTTPVAVDVQLTATEPDEIASAQQALIAWTKQKIDSLQAERIELEDAYNHAVAQKWASGTLKRHATLATKRIEFYEKMKAALEHGYVIIPNFPVTVFAIRTKKNAPLRVFKSSSANWKNIHQQLSEQLPQGEGDYQNPRPVVTKECIKAATQTTLAEYVDYAEEWKDLEFPVQMSKVQIMEATTRAMALKIFDDFGIMPERKKEDPIIVARLLDPRSTTYNRRFVTFMVAWHLNTRDL